MLMGEEQPAPVPSRATASCLVLAFLIPWLVRGVGSTLVGLLALGPRRGDIPELWVCLPAGAGLLLLVGGVLYSYFWRLPRLTIARFACDGTMASGRAPRLANAPQGPWESVASLPQGRYHLLLMNDDVTQFLNALEHGDSHAASRLQPLGYDVSGKVVAQRMAHGQTLQPAALYREDYVPLAGPSR
jgi:hypothetical protein